MIKYRVQLSNQQTAIILLTTATALIHLVLAFRFPDGPNAIFLLNGLGYLALVAALYWPIPQLTPYHNQIRWGLIVYTTLTVALWFFIGARSLTAYLDKLIELALIVLLWLESQKTT